jgi:hypothetical protein
MNLKMINIRPKWTAYGLLFAATVSAAFWLTSAPAYASSDVCTTQECQQACLRCPFGEGRVLFCNAPQDGDVICVCTTLPPGQNEQEFPCS